MNETEITNLIRLEASRKGGVLWRNNCGVFFDATGRPVRYGLNNESKKINTLMKSSDLVGIQPRIITEEDYGKVYGLFTAVEVKKENWKFNIKNKHEAAQARFLRLIYGLGGVAYFTDGGKRFDFEGKEIK